MAGIAGDLFLKLYLVIFVSGKLTLRDTTSLVSAVAWQQNHHTKRNKKETSKQEKKKLGPVVFAAAFLALKKCS